MNKEQILTELRRLRNELPADQINVDEQVRFLTEDALNAARKISSGSATTDFSSEIEDLKEQIRLKE
ncbi:MAG: hypothetical protein IJB82_01065, partial [Bacilli bacterium]|nr:hypothetical protein [Bacilli bacterium]